MWDFKRPLKTDLFLMVIPALSLVGTAPFYFKNVRFKIERIRYVLDNEDSIFHIDQGFISGYWNFVTQLTLGIVFSLIAIYLLIKTIKRQGRLKPKSEYIWLVCIGTLMFLGNFIGLTSLIFDSSSYDTHLLGSYLFALYLSIIFLHPFFVPSVLYGTLLEVKKKISGSQDKKLEVSLEDLENYKSQIENFFTTLNPQVSI